VNTVEQVIAAALHCVGRDYRMGAEGPDAFDCSGLMRWAFRVGAGIRLPRLAHEQQAICLPVTHPDRGDLVFWGDPAHHVGLVLGDGTMVVAPHTGDHVKVEKIYHASDGPLYGRLPIEGDEMQLSDRVPFVPVKGVKYSQKDTSVGQLLAATYGQLLLLRNHLLPAVADLETQLAGLAVSVRCLNEDPRFSNLDTQAIIDAVNRASEAVRAAVQARFVDE